jgi:hypothetical protein
MIAVLTAVCGDTAGEMCTTVTYRFGLAGSSVSYAQAYIRFALWCPHVEDFYDSIPTRLPYIRLRNQNGADMLRSGIVQFTNHSPQFRDIAHIAAPTKTATVTNEGATPVATAGARWTQENLISMASCVPSSGALFSGRKIGWIVATPRGIIASH